MQIMAIGAHPDDLEIFMYGLLAGAAARGDTLHLVVATAGAAGGAEQTPNLAAPQADDARAARDNLGQAPLLAPPAGHL